tara:strand:+ start:251 stop:385 length:135 start_codon:yes stop_codon:yes gene_type:complete
MEIPAKIKAIPGQLRKASKLHAGQADIMQDFLADFVKGMKKKDG